MKKKLLTILLSVLVLLTTLPAIVFADAITVSNVISTTYFPYAERSGDVAWKNSNGATSIWYTSENPGLSFNYNEDDAYYEWCE